MDFKWIRKKYAAIRSKRTERPSETTEKDRAATAKDDKRALEHGVLATIASYLTLHTLIDAAVNGVATAAIIRAATKIWAWWTKRHPIHRFLKALSPLGALLIVLLPVAAFAATVVYMIPDEPKTIVVDQPKQNPTAETCKERPMDCS